MPRKKNGAVNGDDDDRRPRPVKIVNNEARCPEHGHLVGKFDTSGAFVIKCRKSDFVRVEGRSA